MTSQFKIVPKRSSNNEEQFDNITVKQEMDMNDENIHIKSENDERDPENPFQNIEVHVKEEMETLTAKFQDSGTKYSNFGDERNDQAMRHRDNISHLSDDDDDDDDDMLQTKESCNVSSDYDKCDKHMVPKTEIDEDGRADVKNEVLDDLTAYEYPSFDDGSMDSNEAEALFHVEACLQDDGSTRNEQGHFEDNRKEMYDKILKEESDLTVTETHLISNKLINTTSTITNPRDGIIESQTTKTLVMEILPMSQESLQMSKIGPPEDILPTKDTCFDYDDTFQLNSITGNVLSLEQEAYSLLKAKKKKKIQPTEILMCPKCPKTYKEKYSLRRHLSVHETIEKRTMGVLKGLKTRHKNRTKKLKEEVKAEVKQEKVHETIEKRTMGVLKGIKTRHKNRTKKIKEEVKTEVKQEKVKKEGYDCVCGIIFRRKSRMETCLRSHNLFSDPDSYPCLHCNQQFKNKEALALHRKRLHRKRFPCKFCPTDYNTRKELFKHLQAHQKVQLMDYKVISEIVKGKQKLKCFICSKTFSELSQLKCHILDDHQEPYNCPRCHQTFSKIVEFGNHTKKVHSEVAGQSVLDVLEAFSKLVKAWKCEECDLQFYEPDKLALHQIEKHSPDTKSELQFQCADCRRVFISQKGLTSHRRVHHSAESTEQAEPEETGVMCLECRKICKDMNALTSHMRLHSLDRKFPCKFCDFRFATPEKRKAHSEIHTGDMKYVCFICEYQCSSENRLQQHKMSLKHLNMKEFLLTGKPLVEEQSTSKEKKKEWNGKKKKKEIKSEDSTMSRSNPDPEIPCDICGDMFSSESEMLEHKHTHPFIEFPNDDKPTRIFFK